MKRLSLMLLMAMICGCGSSGELSDSQMAKVSGIRTALIEQIANENQYLYSASMHNILFTGSRFNDLVQLEERDVLVDLIYKTNSLDSLREIMAEYEVDYFNENKFSNTDSLSRLLEKGMIERHVLKIYLSRLSPTGCGFMTGFNTNLWRSVEDTNRFKIGMTPEWGPGGEVTLSKEKNIDQLKPDGYLVAYRPSWKLIDEKSTDYEY